MQHDWMSRNDVGGGDRGRGRRRWSVTAAVATVVVGVVLVQFLVKTMCRLVAPDMSAAADLLAEMIAVAIVLGGAAWRLVYLPLLLRQAPARTVVSAPVRDDVVRPRHLRLVD